MMLNKIAKNARATLGGRFAWLLVRKEQLLISEAYDSDSDAHVESFFSMIERHYPKRVFPLATGDNLLADVLLRNVPLVGMEVTKPGRTADAEQLLSAFNNINLNYVTIVPLRYGKLLNGILIVGHDDDVFVRSEHGQNLIKILRRQISLELNQSKIEGYASQLEDASQQRAQLYENLINAFEEGVLVVGNLNQVVHVNDTF